MDFLEQTKPFHEENPYLPPTDAPSKPEAWISEKLIPQTFISTSNFKPFCFWL